MILLADCRPRLVGASVVDRVLDCESAPRARLGKTGFRRGRIRVTGHRLRSHVRIGVDGDLGRPERKGAGRPPLPRCLHASIFYGVALGASDLRQSARDVRDID